MKSTVTVSIDSVIIADAREKGINISAAAENGIRAAMPVKRKSRKEAYKQTWVDFAKQEQTKVATAGEKELSDKALMYLETNRDLYNEIYKELKKNKRLKANKQLMQTAIIEEIEKQLKERKPGEDETSNFL